MKSISYLLLGLLFIFGACSYDGAPGPRGPQGPSGIDGKDGEEAFVFEYENIDFTAPNYKVFLDFPSSFQMLNSDVALVYLLWDVITVNGQPVDVWRQIPHISFTPNGILQYNFDFTKNDVSLFLEAEFNLDFLGGIYTDNWVARVVVIPGQFGNRTNIDYSNYHEVKKALGLKDLPIPAQVVSRQ